MHTRRDDPDAHALARFYRDLLGWPVRKEEPGWVEIAPPDGGAAWLSFQTELDIEVTDLPAAVERAVALGARPADPQPQDDVRVLYDPAGHPFCLFTRTTAGA
ncbi:VOC family protein [Streptomyces longwoodensis]|uniref:VOC family protein n=1 Tax=Streptomyces longwoodensis TaxID=68231 RepID=UPI003691E1E4